MTNLSTRKVVHVRHVMCRHLVYWEIPVSEEPWLQRVAMLMCPWCNGVPADVKIAGNKEMTCFKELLPDGRVPSGDWRPEGEPILIYHPDKGPAACGCPRKEG